MTSRGMRLAAGLLSLALLAPDDAVSQAPAEQPTAGEETLVLLSVDAASLPGVKARKPEASPPQWRTSFGSERRSEAPPAKPDTAVDADIVMLQGVTDYKTLRRWFPAGQWRLVVSRQLVASSASTDPVAAESTPPPQVPTTAVAVRLTRGLRLTGEEHLLTMSYTGDAPNAGSSPAETAAAGTAVRVRIGGRETWAVSVLLPASCSDETALSCPARAALERWHAAKEAEGARRATGGRFAPRTGAGASCNAFGLRLDPAPKPPKAQYTAAAPTADLGCAASVTVAR